MGAKKKTQRIRTREKEQEFLGSLPGSRRDLTWAHGKKNLRPQAKEITIQKHSVKWVENRTLLRRLIP